MRKTRARERECVRACARECVCACNREKKERVREVESVQGGERGRRRRGAERC